MNLTEQALQLMDIRDAILAALKEADTGRWQWDKIDCCMTGKDADLEPWGQQGIEFKHIHNGNVYFSVHCGITYVGDDVSLNLPNDTGMNDDPDWERAREAYLEQAQEVVCSGPGMGEWDGDSWYFHDEFKCHAALVYIDGVFNLDATMQSIFECYQEAVKSWDVEAAGVSHTLNMLSGWKNADGTDCEPGKPTAAAWMPDPEETDDDE